MTDHAPQPQPDYGPSQKSFARPVQEIIPFDVGGETFGALKHPPGEAMFGIMRVLAIHNSDAGKAAAIGDFLDLVLTEESATRFALALRDREHPITAETAGDVVEWLTRDVYKTSRFGRPDPTTSTSPGTPLGSTDGPGSMAGAPVEASTL